MVKGDARRQRKIAGMFVQPPLQLDLCRLAERREILGEEVHLLSHAANNDGVVLVESHGNRFAVQHLLMHFLRQHDLPVGRRRVGPPLRAPREQELL